MVEDLVVEWTKVDDHRLGALDEYEKLLGPDKGFVTCSREQFRWLVDRVMQLKQILDKEGERDGTDPVV